NISASHASPASTTVTRLNMPAASPAIARLQQRRRLQNTEAAACRQTCRRSRSLPVIRSEVVTHRHIPVARQTVVGGLDVADAGDLLAFGLVLLVGQVAYAGADLPGHLRRIPHAIGANQR